MKHFGCSLKKSSKYGTSINKERNVLKVMTRKLFANIATAQIMEWMGKSDFLMLA